MDRGSQLSKDDKDDKEDEEEEDEAGGGGGGGGAGGGGGGAEQEEEEATDIKSNNPHLAGGEKHTKNIQKHQPLRALSMVLVSCGHLQVFQVLIVRLGGLASNFHQGSRVEIPTCHGSARMG